MDDKDFPTIRTICFPINDKGILLAMKLTGFGAGNYNGFGGKFDREQGDIIIEDTAVRELAEESTLTATVADLDKRAIIDFFFPANPLFNQRVHVYFLNRWTGIPQRTKEMAPELFKVEEIPYKKMWDSDRTWLPYLLEGRKIYAIFNWKNDNKTVDNYTITDLK